ncbi:MAG: thermonuclease family protein [Bacilli bacterium]|nr:thermonuclease family protein [Bacilli bacterium]
MKALTNIILACIITVLLILFLNPVHARESIYGTPRVIDGDTIEIKGEKIRLICVDTPESNYRKKTQYCLDNETDCGLLAKQALQNMIGTHDVWCEYEKRDVYGRILGVCQEYNFFYKYPYWSTFNYALVEQGYAWYYNGGKECKPYKAIFEEAKKEGYGLFNEEFGGFKEPKLWRKTRSND